MIQTVRTAARLAARPILLTYIYLLALSAAAPILILDLQLGDNVDPFQAQYVDLVVWGQILFLVPMLGATINQIFSPVLNKPLSLTTPELRNRLLHARVAVNVVVSLSIAAAISIVGRPEDSIPAFCCSLLFFELGFISSDPGTRNLQQVVVWIGGVATLIFLRPVTQFLESRPVAVTLVAAGCSALLLAAAFSRRRASDRVNDVSNSGTQVTNPFTPIFFRKEGQDVAFTAHPSSGRTVDWLRALDYEMFGARRYGTAKEIGFYIVLFCLYAYVFSNTQLPAMMGILFAGTGRGFTGKFAYPLRREERAKLIFLSGVLRYATYFAGAGIFSWLILNSGLPRIHALEIEERSNGFLTLVAIYVWTPLALWLMVKFRVDRRMMKLGANQAKVMAVFLGTIFPAIAFAVFLPDVPGGLRAQIGLLLLMLVVGHGLLWKGLKRHFATADLVQL